MQNVKALFDQQADANNGLALNLAQVLQVSASDVTIQLQDGVFAAQKASSCILQPAVGDQVLCLELAQRQFSVIAVLHRAHGQKQEYQFSDNAKLEVNGLTIDRNDEGDLSIMAEPTVLVNLKHFKISAIEGQGFIGEMNLAGAHFKAHFNKVERVADVVEEVAKTVNRRFENSFKWVEGVDQTVAKNVISRAKGLMTWRSKQAMITSEEDMRIDGERIHMG